MLAREGLHFNLRRYTASEMTSTPVSVGKSMVPTPILAADIGELGDTLSSVRTAGMKFTLPSA